MFSSIRLRIALAYLLLLSAALVFAGFSVNSIVQGFLIDQRVGEQEKIADDIAVSVAPNFANANAAAVYDIVVKYGQELCGRVLVLDTNGIVQVDSFSKLNGVRLTQDEIEQVRVGNRGAAHGLHQLSAVEQQTIKPTGETKDASGNTAQNQSVYVMYYASSIVYDGHMLGVLVLSVPIQDIIDQVGQANAQMQTVFVITCIVVVIMSVWVAQVIAKPIVELTEVIEKMSAGQVHQRVRVTGKSELSRLGAAFNTMSEQLERIEKNRNEFVSDVSHELRTPLSSMKILIESMIYDENIDM
ncbi:MAG: HAMP domain-containing protein, partial [Bacillota bacterium]